jgi:hypothetical protein
MKYVAILITLVLFGVMGYLMIDARNEARGASNELELMRRQQTAAPAPTAPSPGPDAGTRPSRPAPTPEQLAAAARESEQLMANAATSAPLMLPPPQPAPGTPIPGAPGAGAGLANPAATQIAPMPPTPRQRQVMAAPPIARVDEVEVAGGFVVISAGAGRKIEAGMSFAIRRGDSIVARIQVTGVEEGSAIADIVRDSIPLGVTLQAGDDVIQDLPPL